MKRHGTHKCVNKMSKGANAIPFSISAGEDFGIFNVFQYITFRTIYAAVTALVLVSSGLIHRKLQS